MMDEMIRIVIVEDEQPATDRLIRLLKQFGQNVEIVKTLDSVLRSTEYFSQNETYDLIFMDIQLGDGLSLDIFDHVPVNKPVIFVTAYDDYTLKAFKVNSIDYLLKPIDKDDLFHALNQFVKMRDGFASTSVENDLLEKKKKLERFLVKKGNGLKIVSMDNVAYFYSEDGYLHIMERDGKKHIIDNTLDNLFKDLDHTEYFRISRKMIVRSSSIKNIGKYTNSRLILDLEPAPSWEVIVSREKCKSFKNWLK